MNVPEATDNRGLKHMFVSVSTFDNKQSFACFLTKDRCDLAKKVISVVELRGAQANLHLKGFSASNQIHVHVLCQFKGDQEHRS